MGQKPFPRGEKLSFIIRRLSEGTTDSEIQDDLDNYGAEGKVPLDKPGAFLRVGPRTLDNIKAVYKAAEEILKDRLRRESDPALQKAQEEHLDEISSLISEWKAAIKTSRIDEVYLHEDSAPWAETWIEKNLLFKAVKEHLPFESLWSSYSKWKIAETQYRDAGRKLRQRIRQALTLPGRIADSFEQQIMRNVERKRLGQNIEQLEFWAREYNVKSGLTVKEFFVNRFRTVEEIPIEANISEYEKKYQEIHDEVLRKEFAPLKRLSDNATGLQSGIQPALQEILLRRDYIRYNCTLCPMNLT